MSQRTPMVDRPSPLAPTGASPGLTIPTTRVISLLCAILLCLWLGPTLTAAIVDDVRTTLARGDFASADRQIAAFRKAHGATAELAEAISWEARTALTAKNYPKAQAYADQTRELSLQLLKRRKLDADKWLPIALGASIEVEAKIMAARGETSNAVAFLQREFQTYRTTSIAERISKNINLLSLEGKPAPAIDATQWIGAKPSALASLKGKPVLLFFWAHWCPDCKEEAPLLANIMRKYTPRGLIVMAPTRYYGYVEEGRDAPPTVERKYIEQVRARYYSQLASVPIPLSGVNFTTWGCSSTPTLALVDKQGIVRWYHPGAATEAELIRAIDKVI
ncbi:MAG: TlpA disulfide reductase family protein [Acidobacteriota bacterium]